ncbi:hypothetical protein CA850_23310 [Micromonospora echinospora]|uniref:Polyketide cyclase / dehydrase and lipid transport n=1 Tax=Micromonospora echinospora TaxID=1877 RepID=A0A1C4YSN6_MICEC|nr:SRPBCC family protein [Micromonospora echinospora]OZV77385.1 hypothetical protein CA850_23310 [Micromonospora echinospora]SCF23763.1 Polyketide cyclase / dehydrase and lipid transport [Micromonospora echinospora]
MTGPADSPTLGAQTMSVSIQHPPNAVWELVSDVSKWPRFVPAVRAAKQVSEGEFHLTTQLGIVVLRTGFRREHLILDHLLVVPAGMHFTHACRLVQNYYGTEAVLTAARRPRESSDDFYCRIGYLRAAMDGLREIL